MGDVKTEDLWHPYRDLFNVVNKHLTSENHDPTTFGDFEKILRKYRQNFFALLQNLPKNKTHREELKKGQDDGITVKGIGHQVLSKELYQEIVIISDMFDLNEYVALDLLCTAQMQVPFFFELPRGLVAVALYYDGRKYLLSTLRMLLQARTGISWSMNLPLTIQRFIDSYTAQLFDNGLFTRLLELLRDSDLTKELDLLQANLALGGPSHRKRVTDTFNSIRLLLADCVFITSCQSGLNQASMLTLIQHLRECNLEEDSAGKLGNVTLYLTSALIYGMDLSVIHLREDGEDVVRQLPIVADASLLPALVKELSAKCKTWTCQGLQSMAVFALAVCTSMMRLISTTQNVHFAEEEGELIDLAIAMRVFDFMQDKFLANEQFVLEEFMVKRVHNMLCDFIVQMYPKVKELRLTANETAKTIQSYVHEGLAVPPHLPRDFEGLLLVLAKLHQRDENKLELMMDFWCPIDSAHNLAQYRTHPRAVALFKFVRLAGDMLPPSLFVPYLKLLRSLSNCQQGARHCFNMLKQPVGYSNTVSWDHFFTSFNQYYTNLKQDLPNATETIYRHSRTFNKGITPQEIEGLHAVLMLMRTISEQDDFSRMALCEHPGWAPLNVLLGLVSCSIPIPMKADILQVIASLSKSKEIAAQVWNNLESSQILVTIPSTASYQPRGIQTELDEIESRMEEYPLTRAFLTLLDVLTNTGIPRTLGAGPRQPGFDPYLGFITNAVFLKFNARSYKEAGEKWHVASLCLKLLAKFLSTYEPELADFPTNKQSECNSPPGFHLMLQLHSKSEMFNALLYIIAEGNSFYDNCVTSPGKEFLDAAIYSCLCILDRCLKLQSKYFALLTSSNCQVLLVSLHKLLLTPNSRSGRPDHVLNIMKYLNYQSQLPKQTLMALQILRTLVSSPLTHSHIMAILLPCNQEKYILHGFVKCLDEMISEESDFITLAKKEIFGLLHQCLGYNFPNLAQFLFGFDVRRNARSGALQLPAAASSPRTCIQSLLTLLRHILMGRLDEEQVVIEECYHMLYALCANPLTGEAVLRLLRRQSQFFKKHIAFCHRSYMNGIHELNQMSWLLKTLAIELRLTCCNKQIVNLKQITSVLVGMPNEASQSDFIEMGETIGEPKTEDFVMTIEHLKQDNFLVNLISNFDMSIPAVDAPEWSFFDQASLDSYLQRCNSERNAKQIDVKKLHRNLIEEVTATQGAAALGQRQAMVEEVQKVLMHAVNINNSRKCEASTCMFVDAWRQVVQVLVTYLPIEIIAPKDQVLLQIYLLDVILSKCISTVMQREVADYLSGTLVLLVENMRKSHIKDEKFKQMLFHGKRSDTKSILELNLPLVRSVLNNLVQWIIISDNQAQTQRMNLYAALGIFLQLIAVIDREKDEKGEDSLYVSRLDNSKYQWATATPSNYMSFSVLLNFGEKLIDVFCYDCTGGQEICKMLALCCFSLLLALNPNANWINQMMGKGYLKHIIDSIRKMDGDLRQVLEPQPENFKSIYLYDAKMSFLVRIAQSRLGAEFLLAHKIFSVLSTLSVLDYHPELLKNSNESGKDSMIMPAQQRYFQIWIPALYLCNAILTSLGADHQSAVEQIVAFLRNHLDVVELILRSSNPSMSADALQETAMITSIIGRTATNEVVSTVETTDSHLSNHVQLYRMQKLMLALLPKFSLHESTLRELLSDPHNSQTSYQTSDRLSYALEIIYNLLMYARNVTENNGVDHDSVGVIFQPTLSDTALVCVNGNSKRNASDHSPPLGTVIQILINSVSYYHKEKATLDFLKRKEQEIPRLDAMDLKELGVRDGFDISIMRDDALEIISTKLQLKKHDINHCLLIIEHAMYIIWAHLNHYMLKAIPKGSYINSSAQINYSFASSTEAMWRVTTDELSSLKQGLVSIFNDSFCHRLIETSQGRSSSDSAFMDILLRKIKRLIQFVPVK